MSLLDILKYPIGNSPTEEQFAALPEDLFCSWALAVGWCDTVDYSGAERISYMSRAYSSRSFMEGGDVNNNDLALLRRMIYELV